MGQGPRFTTTDDGREVAYRVLSEADGPLILHTAGGTAPIEVLDEDALYRRFLETLGGYGRLVLFDRPGIGASDPFDPERDLLAQTADAIVAVLDAVGAEQACLAIDGSTGAFLVAHLVRDHGHRLAGAAVLNPLAPLPEHLAAPDVDTVVDQLVQRDQAVPRSGIHGVVPSRADDPAYVAWAERAGRLGATAAGARAYWSAAFAAAARIDAAPIDGAPPLLLIHRRDAIHPDHLAWWAGVFPDAEVLTIEGVDRSIPTFDAAVIADTMGEFLAGERRPTRIDRPLVALLFTDLVDSTPAVAAAGDAVWRSTLDRFEARVSATVERHGGTVVKHTGDGALATFATGSSAVRAARELRSGARDLDLDVRTGVHVGEVEQRGQDIGGLAVHLAARVMGQAGPGQVLLTSTVVQATAGGSITARPLGPHTLKGIDQPWDLFVLDSAPLDGP